MVLFVILRCNANLSFLINLYFHSFIWHLQVLIMQKGIQYQCPHSKVLPGFRVCLVIRKKEKRGYKNGVTYILILRFYYQFVINTKVESSHLLILNLNFNYALKNLHLNTLSFLSCFCNTLLQDV